jgi:hypothetical protein
MALVADAVDAHAVRLDQLDDAGGALELGAQVLEVVVVVVELGGGVGGGGGAEGDGDVGLADDAEEDVVAVGAVLVEGWAWSAVALPFWFLLFPPCDASPGDSPSLTTSQWVHFPLYRPISWLMWLVMTEIRVALLKLLLETQLGSCEYHTRVWQRTCLPFCVAQLTCWSAAPKLNWPRLGSVASHFCAFSGVMEPNSLLMMFCSCVSLRTVRDVPMYPRPAATMAALRVWTWRWKSLGSC